MFYDDKIESLISVALTDGVLTDKEKQVLIKKAEGIDSDEFEMVLEARLHEAKTADKIEPSTTSSAQDLAKIVEEIYADADNQKEAARKEASQKSAEARQSMGVLGNMSELGESFGLLKSKEAQQLDILIKDIDAKTQKRVNSAIQLFPVPTSRTALIEFIIAMKAHKESVYKTKYNEALDKAEVFFPTDPILAKLIQERDNQIIAEKKAIEEKTKQATILKQEKEKQEHKKTTKKVLMKLIPVILATIAVIFEWIVLDWGKGWILLVSFITIILITLIGYAIMILIDLFK